MTENKAELQKAKKLIENKRYEDAYALLITLDDPIAEKWMQRLETLIPAKTTAIDTRPPAWIRYSSLLLGTILATLLLLVLFGIVADSIDSYKLPKALELFVIVSIWILSTVVITRLVRFVLQNATAKR